MVNGHRARRISQVMALLAALGATVLPARVVEAAPTVAEATPRGAGPLAFGSVAPPLAADRISGSDAVSLDELRGRVVVVDFWATWCGPCHEIMPSLDALHRRHHDRGLTVLGVAREPDAHIRAHLARNPVAYTVARDVGGTLARYGVRALPMLVVIDRAGTVRDVVVGTDGATMARLDTLVQRLLAEPHG